METLEEYLAKRKHKDHMDEFNLNRHPWLLMLVINPCEEPAFLWIT